MDLEKDDYAIADEIKAFLEKCMEESKSKVPSWSEVVEAYIKYKYLYGGE